MTDETSKELVLPPGQYAYMQDTTKGTIRCHVGPLSINQTAQEVPVIYDPRKGIFSRVASLANAVRQSPVAVEGYYLVLFNPAVPNANQPSESSAAASPELQIGRRVVIPGPAMFPLWPGQAAQVIRGHQLSRNEYLKVRVYNETEARAHWGQAIIQPQVTPGEDTSPIEETQTLAPPEDLTVGRELVIKGEDVSFFIPHTGLTVVPDGTDDSGQTVYVRDALTLERLEYCVLVDEDGNKRYERGPQVVFPAPTETFIEDKTGSRKFRAIELNKIQGIHIKVIEGYTEDDGTTWSTGDEFFLTGLTCQIYYPRKEHSLVRYDGQAKHFATAVPAGEGRYVMNRNEGSIEMVTGPAMLLPDPTEKVIVRRVLTPKQCELWYPNNSKVAAYNDSLRAAMAASPSTRSGVVSEGDYERSTRRRAGKTKGPTLSADTLTRSVPLASNSFMESSVLGEQVGQGAMADEFSRQSTYSQPRTVTLSDTEFGVPMIQPYTGYAVMVVNKTGDRRVVQGPTTVLLEYDEALEVLELSTGKPKSTDTLLRTVYLRTSNNKVADLVTVTSSDHVDVTVKVSYVVNFVGEPTRWFALENYVKYLCDHMRSMLKGQAKKEKIADLYADPSGFVRDVVLGLKGDAEHRPGRTFEENGMHVSDVEVLHVQIEDARIRSLLHDTQHTIVASNIQAQQAEHDLDVTTQLETYKREKAQVLDATKAAQTLLDIQLVERELEKALTTHAAKLRSIEEGRKVAEAEEIERTFRHGAELDRQKAASMLRLEAAEAQQKLDVERLQAEAQSVVERFTAASGPFAQTLAALGDAQVMATVAKAGSLQNALMGDNTFTDALHRLFGDTTLGHTFKRLAANTANGFPEDNVSKD